MKVCFLTQVFPKNSSDYLAPFLLSLSSALQKLGTHIDVVCPHDRGLKSHEIIEGARIHRFRYAPERYEVLAYRGRMHELIFKNLINLIVFGSFLVSFLINAFSCVRKNKIDIIHAHWWLPTGLIGAVISKVTGRPLVITSHGTDVFLISRFAWLKILSRWVYKQAEAITVVSTSLRKILIEELGVERGRITVIPMPVDVKRFYPVEKKKDIDILFVGRLVKKKGVHILVEAINLIKSDREDIKAVIVGDGPEKRSLEELVDERGLKSNVKFVNNVPNDRLIDYYNASKVFVLPTMSEGLGVVLLEAMSCKVPVVATATGGVTDIIINDKTGLLLQVNNEENIAKAIGRVLSDDRLRNRLSVDGYNFINENFTPGTAARRFLDVYEGLSI